MKMSMALVLASGASLALGAAANAGLSSSLPGPGLQTFNNGGGSGFGGELGSGSISFQVVNSGADLRLSFAPSGGFNNLATVFLDTRAGGQDDSTMNDDGDGGRRVSSNLTRDLNDVMPDLPSLPDFSVVFGSFGVVVFELNAGNTNNHLQFQIFTGGGSVDIPLALLGGPSAINWFAAYTSDSGYNSNESIPASPSLNGVGNVGFGNGEFGGLTPPPAQVVYDNYNQYTVPAPAAAALLGLGGLAASRRRRA